MRQLRSPARTREPIGVPRRAPGTGGACRFGAPGRGSPRRMSARPSGVIDVVLFPGPGRLGSRPAEQPVADCRNPSSSRVHQGRTRLGESPLQPPGRPFPPWPPLAGGTGLRHVDRVCHAPCPRAVERPAVRRPGPMPSPRAATGTPDPDRHPGSATEGPAPLQDPEWPAPAATAPAGGVPIATVLCGSVKRRAWRGLAIGATAHRRPSLVRAFNSERPRTASGPDPADGVGAEAER